MNLIREIVELHMRAFPLAEPKAQRRQATRLIRAKRYLAEKGIYCTLQGNAFEYKAATGSVLK